MEGKVKSTIAMSHSVVLYDKTFLIRIEAVRKRRKVGGLL